MFKVLVCLIAVHFHSTFIHCIGLCKTIDKLAKRKDCEDVGPWRQSISNHMYWTAASTPNGDGLVMQEKWKMMALHIQNIHTNQNSDTHPECGHGELEGEARNRLWLQPGKVKNKFKKPTRK